MILAILWLISHGFLIHLCKAKKNLRYLFVSICYGNIIRFKRKHYRRGPGDEQETFY